MIFDRRCHTDAQRDRHSAGPQPFLLPTTIDNRFKALMNVAADVQCSDPLWAVCLVSGETKLGRHREQGRRRP